VTRAVAAAVMAGLVLTCSGGAEAQSWELSALAGYTPDAGLDRQAPELEALDVRGGFTWGGSVSRSLGRRWDAEVLWMEQQSGLELGVEDGSPTLFEFKAGDLHGHAVYHFADRDTRLRPFLIAGLGATFFRGGGQPSETKLSWTLGGGVKYSPWRRIGLRGHVRYKPVNLSDEEAGDFCDPFGFCQGWLHQMELAGGVVVRF
jgi:opacity protein-like surface antigen